MIPNSAPTAASPSPAAEILVLDAAAPDLEELLEAAPPAVADVELVDVPLAEGVADEAGYVEPTGLISNACD